MPTNNIASPRRIDLGSFAGRFSRTRVATIIATVLLTIILVTFRPFQPSGSAVDGKAIEGGDIVNQLGFGTLGGLAIFSLMAFADRRTLSAILGPWWIVLLALFGLSVFDATDPPSAFRAALFTLIGMLAIAAILTIPRDADSFSKVILTAGVIVLGMSYAGLLLFPNEAMHTAASLEPEHAGLWRGVFSHKNVAAPVMACFSFAGIYLYRRHWRRAGIALFVLAMIFMLNTGSKTTAGLVPASILIVVLPSLIGMRLLTPLLFALIMAGTALGTLGIVFLEPMKQLAAEFFPDLTYTGRTALWEFSGEMIARQPWTGYGYESFWGTPFLSGQDQPFDRDWDIRGIVHGHNGYLDIAVIMGLPALGAAVMAFLVEPLRDYLRIPLRRENIFLGDFFMMVVLFTALNAFLESFFFRRADPVWMFFVMGVFGLRLVARFPMKARAGA